VSKKVNPDGFRSFLAFALLPGFSIITPLLVYPAVSSSFGPSGFGAIAVGQSVGTAVAVVVELAWGLTGPAAVARADSATRSQLVFLSLGARSLIFVVLGTGGAAVAAIVTPSLSLAAALSAAAFAMAGLSFNWFFIGIGNPIPIFCSDVLPKLAAAAGASVALLNGLPLWLYPALQMLANSFGLVVALRLSKPELRHWRTVSIGQHVSVLREQSSYMLGRSISAIYVSLPVVIVTAVAPSLGPLYAAVDRVLRMFLAILQAVPNMLHSWIGRGHIAGDFHKRVRRAILGNVVLGVIACATFSVLCIPTTRLVFAGVLEPDLATVAFAAIVVLVVCVSRSTGSLALVHSGRTSWVSWSALAGAIVGLPAVAAGAFVWDTAGAFSGLLAAEVAVLVVQIVALARHDESVPQTQSS
jgi:O-antigen/teichoic acid export membrane protein